jgi:1-deoxy-D-xylulose-5-phosphate synthase
MLEKINKIEDIKKLSLKEKELLAEEIRIFLVEKVSKTGGHLASNLGVVELTIALMSVFNFDEDKIVWDVGHQSYVYKILTGRKNKFNTLRQHKGIRGFPYKEESIYDHFETGHSSTSISASLGMARSRDIKNEKHNVIAVIGDGSISNGMSLEAINDVGFNKTPLIIILNDNGMSIDSNVGGLSSYFSKISINENYNKIKNKVKHSLDGTTVGDGLNKILGRLKDGIREFLVPSNYFDNMGITYIGPIDGHDIDLMTKALERVKKVNKPVLIHIVTKKGKGYELAEESPEVYHAVSTFDSEIGVQSTKKETYSGEFGNIMVKLASKNDKLVAITAAMCDGVGLKEFSKKHPKRFFDVGISEEHAVTFAAGLATDGMVPVVAMYSTFLQRGFDQVIHDVAMQKNHVVFAIDRAGLVGNDGETHQGIFDLSYLSMVPNLIVMAPKSIRDMNKIFEWAVNSEYPVAIRYPRGGDKLDIPEIKKVELGKWEVISKGEKVAIIATGKMVEKALEVKEKYKLDVMIINALFIKPLDIDLLKKLVKEKYNILTIEDNVINGGLGSNVLIELNKLGFNKKIKVLGFDDKFVPQGTVDELYKQESLDVDSIYEEINRLSMSK